MKALITGGKGFIGSYLKDEFEQNGYEVVCCDLIEDDGIVSMDIMNQELIQRVLETYHPDVLVNLAGQANVGMSWKKPQLTVELNTVGLINILEAVKTVDKNIRVIAIGSSDEYGNLKEQGVNVKEDIPIHPITPYAISKQAQEVFSRLYVSAYGMDICMVRLFNLGGGGQAKGFMLSDFSSSIAEVETGKSECIYVGNLSSARDFTHVKDAVRAIRLIVEKGFTGEIYNICSGITITAQEVLDKLLSKAKKQIEVKQDPKRMRASDTPVICGNHDKLTEHTGWKPQYTIDQIIEDSLRYWRNKTEEMLR